MAATAALCWGLSSIFVKLALEDPAVDLLTASVVRLGISSAFLFTYAWLRGGKLQWDKQSPRFLVALLVVGGVGGTLSPMLWMYGVEHAGVARTAVLGATSPLFGLPLSVLILGEKLTARTLLGTLLTTVGVWFVL